MERDVNLDYYRGLASIWVLFIHSIYWIWFFTSPEAVIAKSYLLFEMPLLFFITGATNSLSKNSSNLISFYIRRIKRIVIPYWIYAFIWILILQITVTFLNVKEDIQYFEWLIFGFRNNLWTGLPYITWHLWFIPVYLLILFLIPLLKFLYNYFQGKKKIIPLCCMLFLSVILVIVKIENYNLNYYTKNIIVYCFFVYLGLFYSDFKIKRFNKNILIISIGSYSLVFLMIKLGFNIDMQVNKFPPNIAFLILNIGSIFVIIYFKNYILKVIKYMHLNKVIGIIGQYSYTVYLYQPLGFLIASILLDVFNIFPYDYDILGSLYYFIFNILVALINIKIFGKFEKLF